MIAEVVVGSTPRATPVSLGSAVAAGELTFRASALCGGRRPVAQVDGRVPLLPVLARGIQRFQPQ